MIGRIEMNGDGVISIVLEDNGAEPAHRHLAIDCLLVVQWPILHLVLIDGNGRLAGGSRIEDCIAI